MFNIDFYHFYQNFFQLLEELSYKDKKPTFITQVPLKTSYWMDVYQNNYHNID